MNLIQRLKEPSTWAGLGILAVTMGLDPHKAAAVAQVAQIIAPFVPADGGVIAQTVIGLGTGLAAILLPERKPAPAQVNDA